MYLYFLCIMYNYIRYILYRFKTPQKTIWRISAHRKSPTAHAPSITRQKRQRTKRNTIQTNSLYTPSYVTYITVTINHAGNGSYRCMFIKLSSGPYHRHITIWSTKDIGSHQSWAITNTLFREKPNFLRICDAYLSRFWDDEIYITIVSEN